MTCDKGSRGTRLRIGHARILMVHKSFKARRLAAEVTVGRNFHAHGIS
jgi:hypothetical protein